MERREHGAVPVPRKQFTSRPGQPAASPKSGFAVFVFFSNKVGILGSIAVTLVLSFVLVKACSMM